MRTSKTCILVRNLRFRCFSGKPRITSLTEYVKSNAEFDRPIYRLKAYETMILSTLLYNSRDMDVKGGATESTKGFWDVVSAQD